MWREGEEGPGANWPQRPGSRDGGLTGAHGVREVPPRAGLPVLEVVLEQHLAQLVALWGKE